MLYSISCLLQLIAIIFLNSNFLHSLSCEFSLSSFSILFNLNNSPRMTTIPWFTHVLKSILHLGLSTNSLNIKLYPIVVKVAWTLLYKYPASYDLQIDKMHICCTYFIIHSTHGPIDKACYWYELGFTCGHHYLYFRKSS